MINEIRNFIRDSVVAFAAGAVVLCAPFPAAAADLSGRELAIAQRLDCLSKFYGSELINWEDVCAVKPAATQDASEDEILSGLQQQAEALRQDEPVKEKRGFRLWPFSRSSAETTDAADEQAQVEEEETRASGFRPWPFSRFARSSDREFDLALSVSSWDWDFKDSLQLQGLHGGANARYTFITRENDPIQGIGDLFTQRSNVNRFTFEGRLIAGQVEHEIAHPDADDKVFNIAGEGRVLFGYDIPFANGKMLTGYTGSGFRFSRTEMGQTFDQTTALPRYDFTSAFYYLPIGINFKSPVGESWEIGLRAEYDFLYYARYDFQFSDMRSIDQDVKLSLNDGAGYKASMRLVKKNPDSFDLYIEPYVDLWKLQNSELGKYIRNDAFLGFTFAPDLEIFECGARVGIVY